MIKFIKSSLSELKKIKWPTREQAMDYTKNVIIVSLLLAIFLGILDLVFTQLVTKVII